MSRANVHSRSAIYPVLCDRVEGDQFLFEEEMHETENWSMDREMEKDERGRGGLWYFASSCSIDGALKLINPRRQSASFVLSSILNVSAYCTRFTQTRVSSIPRLNVARRSLDPAWNLYLKSLERNARFSLPWPRSVCNMTDAIIVCTSQRERD